MDKLIYTNKELKQGSDEWKEKRKTCLGGSDIAAVIGANQYETAFSLWGRKTGRIPPKEMNEAMLRGSLMESESHPAIKLHLLQEGIKNPVIEPLFALHPIHSFLGVSFDGVDIDNKFITEIKCPLNAWNFKSVVEKGIQKYYYPQVQLQLEVAFATWGIHQAYFCSYYPDGVYILDPLEFKEHLKTLKVIEAKYDSSYCEDMIKMAKVFWNFIEADAWDDEVYNKALGEFNDSRKDH